MLPKMQLSRLKLTARQWRIFKYAFIGTLLVCIAAAIVTIDPLKRIVKDQLSIREGSFLFGLFKAPPLEVYISVYVFNVTNVPAFLSGDDKKLRLQEVGPYVYREYLDHSNYTFHNNGTLSYVPRRRVEFNRERSVGDPHRDVVTVPNIPLLGATTAAAEMSILAALALSTLTRTLDAQPMLNLTVHDYLWGYEDSLVALASSVVPNIITFERFGLLDRMFDEGENEVTINLPASVARQADERAEQVRQQRAASEQHNRTENTDGNAIENALPDPVMPVRDFSIDMWNGQAGLQYWNYNEQRPNVNTNTVCNTLRGAYDGTVFPQNISKNEEFRVYRKAFCRTLPVRFDHASQLNGLEAYHFELVDNAFDTSLEDLDSSCFCTETRCLQRGLGKITPCYYNIPTAVSYPHFYRSDPALLAGVDGLQPDAARHRFEIVLQPQLGVPMRVHSRIQINLLMDTVRFNARVQPYANLVLPIVWMEISVEQLTPWLIVLLHVLFNVLPYVQVACVCALCVVGVSMYAIAALSFFCLTRWSAAAAPVQTCALGHIEANHACGTTYSKCETMACGGTAEEISRRARDLVARSRPDICRDSAFYWFPFSSRTDCVEDEQAIAMIAEAQATIERLNLA